MSSKKYRLWNPDQMVLFPHAMKDALEEGHIVFRIMDVVESLEISSITDRMDESDPRGTRPYHPRMMLALLIYAYCCGVYSSRKIAAATYDMIPFRVLTGDQHPHFTVINEFRLRHLDAFVDLFVQVLRLCGRAGLLDLEHVSLDGSKVEANASKHKAMSYGRMEEEIKRLDREVRELLARAESADAEEDEKYGKGRDVHEISGELARREKRVEAIRKAKAELEREAREARIKKVRRRAAEQRRAAETETDVTERKRKLTRARKAEEEADSLAGEHDDTEPEDKDPDPEGDLPSHQVPSTPKGTPTPKAQRNFTDPDSRIMKRGGDYIQGYNCQIVVDGAHQIIVAEGVTNQAPDQEHLAPMMDRVLHNIGDSPRRLTADSGYMSDDSVVYCENQGIDAYIAVGRKKHRPDASGKENNDQIFQDNEAWRAMRDKLKTDDGHEVYRHRKHIVEPVFGHVKEARRFRRFSLRGITKVRGEWTLVSLAHNLLKLVNAPLHSCQQAPQLT
jgi:transposase